MAKTTPTRRQQGAIRRRGRSFQVSVYAGLDPVTGKRLYLTDSTTDEAEARRILRRLTAEVNGQRHSRTRATLQATIEAWLDTHELAERTLETYREYAANHIYPVLGPEPLARATPHVLERFYAELRRCADRCDGRPAIDHRVDGPHECQEIRHRRPPGRPPAAGYPPHDCAEQGCRIVACQPHTCRPLAPATVRKIHFIIRGALAAAVRWGWLPTNAAEIARIPSLPPPDPDPPSPAEAASLVNAAWDEGPDWGTLVWLVLVTGLRRAELLALRWFDVDFDSAKLFVRRNHVRVSGKSIEKDTKTHRTRRLSLDDATIKILAEHRQRYEERCAGIRGEPVNTAYLFSYSPANDRPCDPSGITHRYGRMCDRLGIESHLHALRHYSATELLSAGVDLRTVAGRLGHGGGGATTLRVYAAWIDDSDRRAADVLSRRIARPGTERPSSSLDCTD